MSGMHREVLKGYFIDLGSTKSSESMTQTFHSGNQENNTKRQNSKKVKIGT